MSFEGNKAKIQIFQVAISSVDSDTMVMDEEAEFSRNQRCLRVTAPLDVLLPSTLCSEQSPMVMDRYHCPPSKLNHIITLEPQRGSSWYKLHEQDKEFPEYTQDKTLPPNRKTSSCHHSKKLEGV